MLSEIILEGSLSNNLSVKLIELFKLCRTGMGEVTVSKISEFQTTWEHALLKLNPYEFRSGISVMGSLSFVV